MNPSVGNPSIEIKPSVGNPVSCMRSGSFVDTNSFAKKYYFMWFLNILYSEIYANA